MRSGTHKIDWNAHHCPTVVLTCMDFRVSGRKIEEIVAAVYEAEASSVAPFDEIRIAGSAKAINDGVCAELVLDSILIAVEKHEAKRVIIINHHDCGAYGGVSRFGSDEEERRFHAGELRKAQEVVLEHLSTAGKSEVAVDLIYISATGMMPIA